MSELAVVAGLAVAVGAKRADTFAGVVVEEPDAQPVETELAAAQFDRLAAQVIQ